MKWGSTTLRFRITVWYILIFGVMLFVFSATLYFAYRRNVSSDFDAALFRRALSVQRSISINPLGRLEIDPSLITDTGRSLPLQYGSEYIEIRASDGKSVARSNSLGQRSLPMSTETLASMGEGHPVFETIPPSGNEPPFWGSGNLRLISLPLAAQGRIRLLLQIGVSTHAYDQSLGRLRTALFFIGIPLTLLVAGFGGWWLAGRAFQPINQVIAAAQNLGSDRLGERLPVPEGMEEVRHLTETLNEMLERLEKAFQSQQRFVADASHELKTPLTILIGELDVLKQQSRSEAEYRAFLESASEELRQLSQTVQNLLLLAQADAGKTLSMRNGVRLDEVVLGAVERLEPFARSSQVRVRMNLGSAECEARNAENPEVVPSSFHNDAELYTVRGDADLLGSLFFNLIHNAIKFSAAGQSVEVDLVQTPTGPRASIRDFGSGIPPEDLPRIFERFHRAESPTRGQVVGTGLGLTIARWIAEAHGAKITVKSKPAEGSIFTVAF